MPTVGYLSVAVSHTLVMSEIPPVDAHTARSSELKIKLSADV